MPDETDDETMYILTDMSKWQKRPATFGKGEIVKTGDDSYAMQITVYEDVPRIGRLVNKEPEKES